MNPPRTPAFGDSAVCNGSKCIVIGTDDTSIITLIFPDGKFKHIACCEYGFEANQWHFEGDQPPAPSYRWYTQDELITLHLGKPFIIRHKSEPSRVLISKVNAQGNKLYTDVNDVSGSNFNMYEISFDNITWQPVGVKE